jgi:DNA-binding NarL/FixJ family response regulator
MNVGFSVLLADDHILVRQGLRALVEKAGFVVVAEATNGEEAVELAEKHRPQIAVLDLTMPLLNGLEAGRQIVAKGVPVLLLTMHTEEHHVASALRSGIRGYLLKTQAADELTRAIRDVARGQVFLSSDISRIVVDGYLTGAPASDPLAPREREVLQLVAEGMTSKEIAVKLGLSVKTAESYRTHIMEKLDIHDTAGLVRYATRRGLVVP